MNDSSTALGALDPDSLYLELSSGRKFYITSTDTFDAQETAHALSMQCRYGGHSRYFFSVAQHALLVADIMKHLSLGDPFEGLHHDDTEHLLIDMPSPVKALLPEYKALERSLDARIRKFWGLPPTITEGCKRADYIALYVEAAVLIPSGGRGQCWPDPYLVMEDVERYRAGSHSFFNPAIALFSHSVAEAEWLFRHNNLLAARS
jgi:uncharacterized protein